MTNVTASTTDWLWSLLALAFSSWLIGTISTVIIVILIVAWIALGCPGLWIFFMLGGGRGGDSGSSSGDGDFGGGGASDDF